MSAAIAKGLLAGFVGTATMTAVQMVEMRLRKREPSVVPAQAVEKVLRMDVTDPQAERRLANAVHWAYGTSWGAVRGLIGRMGLGAEPATLLHFGLVWGAAARMLPALKLAPPVREWKKTELALDLALHAVYAAAAGVVFERLRERHA